MDTLFIITGTIGFILILIGFLMLKSVDKKETTMYERNDIYEIPDEEFKKLRKEIVNKPTKKASCIILVGLILFLSNLVKIVIDYDFKNSGNSAWNDTLIFGIIIEILVLVYVILLSIKNIREA